MTETSRIKRLSARQNNLKGAWNLKWRIMYFCCFFFFKESIQETVILGLYFIPLPLKMHRNLSKASLGVISREFKGATSNRRVVGGCPCLSKPMRLFPDFSRGTSLGRGVSKWLSTGLEVSRLRTDTQTDCTLNTWPPEYTIRLLAPYFTLGTIMPLFDVYKRQMWGHIANTLSPWGANHRSTESTLFIRDFREPAKYNILTLWGRIWWIRQSNEKFSLFCEWEKGW
jgi:hypothetical protein